MKSNQLICIVCPRGCHLEVETDHAGKLTVKGNFCPRGIPYAHAELKHPERNLSTTVLIRGAELPLVPLKSSAPLPKKLIPKVMLFLSKVCLEAPVHRGDIACANVLGSGIDLLVTRSLPASSQEEAPHVPK